ncbi:MAG: ATP-binding protein [Ghiorsea sp.]
MRRLISRQLKRVYGRDYALESLSDNEQKLIAMMISSFESMEEEHQFYEKTLDVSFQELGEKNKDIKKAASSGAQAQRLAHLGSWFYDVKRNVLEWSDELFRICEVEPQTFEPTRDFLEALVHEEDKVLSQLDADVNQKIELSYRMEFPSGKVKHVKEHYELVHNHRGELVAMQGAIQDVTSQQELEQKLQQSQKMEAVGNLVGGIAHDFNNILAGMVGNLYLVKKQISDIPAAVIKINALEGLAKNAAELISQLLTFSRKSNVVLEELVLEVAFQQTVNLLRHSIPESIQLEFHRLAENLIVNGNETQLNQVLINLVNNAAHAVEFADYPTVTITLNKLKLGPDNQIQYPHLSIGNWVHLSVKDNGEGIRREVIEHLFDPFFTTKEVGKGTGLGLAMVYGAVTSHGGFVDVTSSLGEGATFHVYLPMSISEEVKEPIFAVAEADKGNGELILLVDDEKYLLDVGAELLEMLGYNVLKAEDGIEAFDLFYQHGHKIKLIVTDVVMPRLGGVELMERVHEIEPEMKVIYTSGYDKNSTLARLKDNGLMISKPYNIEELSVIINHTLHFDRHWET